MPAPRHVFRIHIRATPEQVWQAITDPEFTRRYFHRTAFESTLEPGERDAVRCCPTAADAVVGEIEEVEPPRRLVMTWRALYDPAMADEPPSRVEWIIADGGDGVTRRHDDPSRPRLQPDARRPASGPGGSGSSTR